MFPRTEKMRTIVDAMRSARLGSLEQSLCMAVREESEILDKILRGRPRTGYRLNEGEETAERNYVSLILEWLKQPGEELKPNDVLLYRCKATAWAIARRLSDELGLLREEVLISRLEGR